MANEKFNGWLIEEHNTIKATGPDGQEVFFGYTNEWTDNGVTTHLLTSWYSNPDEEWHTDIVSFEGTQQLEKVLALLTKANHQAKIIESVEEK